MPKRSSAEKDAETGVQPNKRPCGFKVSKNGKKSYFVRCEEAGCGGDAGRPATHNFVTEKIRRFCKQHAKAGMVDLKNRRKYCKKCDQRVAHFNLPSEKKGLYCEQCREEGMVNVISKKCIECLAQKVPKPSQPSFNLPDEKVPLYCDEHKKPGMINVKSKKCIQCKIRQPCFNYPGLLAQYCSQCSKDKPGMVNTRAQMCIGCHVKYPCFNVEGETKPLYCRACADQTGKVMVDIANRKKLCIKCHETIGVFNSPGKTKGEFCSRCKEPDMVDVVNRKCADCLQVIPTYNFPGTKTGLYCAGCAASHPGTVDVVNPHCTSCPKIASFGLPGQHPTKCGEHKTSNMLLFPKQRCIECFEWALYGISHQPEYCEDHKGPDDFNLVQKECSVCRVLNVVDHEGKCGTCSAYLNNSMVLYKQRMVKKWIDERLSEFKYESYDKQVDGGECGKERPDFLWDAGTHKVVLEVDEDQHKGRPCECEQTRMVNLTHAFGMPTLWIRFNPDTYITSGSEVIKPRNPRRSEMLIRVLRDSMKDAPKTPLDFCRIVHLFFDNFDHNQPLETVRIKVE